MDEMTTEHGEWEPLLSQLTDLAQREGVSPADWVAGLAAPPTAEDALAQRLAEEYEVLCREVPEAGAFEALPTEALREAVEQEIPLLDAYLRHAYREQRRVAAEQEAAAAAAAATLGSQSDTAHETASPVIEAMMRGVWSK